MYDSISYRRCWLLWCPGYNMMHLHVHGDEKYKLVNQISLYSRKWRPNSKALYLECTVHLILDTVYEQSSHSTMTDCMEQASVEFLAAISSEDVYETQQ